MISTESKFLSKHRTKYDFVTVTFKVTQSKKRPNKREYTSLYLSIIAIIIIMCLHCNVSKIFAVCMLFCNNVVRD